MDKIWDRNPSKSEIIGRCGTYEKMTTQNRQKSNANKKKEKREQRLVSKMVLSACFYTMKKTETSM